MPVEVYKALIAKAQEWAAIDVDEYAASLPIKDGDKRAVRLSKMNNKKQANRIKRAGVQWSAILRFAVNTGADNADICCLKWENLHLDGELSYCELERSKTSEYRITPLLPATVKAIQEWREYEQQYTDTVFRNDGKKPYLSDKVSKAFTRLRESIDNGDGWAFKHLRNCGPTCGRDGKRPAKEREAFLGHAVNGMNQFYETGYDEHWLIDLVNLIGVRYFDGEQVD